MAGFLGVAIADLLWPPVCAVCPRPLPLVDDGLNLSAHFCPECLATVEIPSAACRLCGRPLAGVGEHVCGDCLVSPPPYAGARSAALHQGAVAHSISLLKYYGQLRQLKALSALGLSALARPGFSHDFDLVVPMPLSAKRQAERGFNQTFELARRLFADRPELVNVRLLQRSRDEGLHQASLAAAQRRRAIRGHFQVAAPETVRGARLLLFDDVMTTGATAGEAARVLLKAGAAEVRVFTISRTRRHFW
ncbi:MAG: double zinc ribbon domain-containing protein [Candidatus Adiutrix sp.]|jgi:ComF family protein|nr:double zinc ribbon domain-containing protein [Candidatus Adiutrix sp.]